MPDETPPQPTPRITRTSQWRVIYTNTTGLSLGDTDVRLVLGFDLDLTKPGSSILEEAVVAMPLKSAKLLAYTLSAVIAKWEALNGPIPIPAEKFQEIDNQLNPHAQPTAQSDNSLTGKLGP